MGGGRGREEVSGRVEQAGKMAGEGRVTTGAVAASLGGELVGPSDLVIEGVSGVEDDGEGAITFIRSREFGAKWGASGARAAVVTRGVEVTGHDPTRRALIYVEDADRAMVSLLRLFMPRRASPAPGRHATAVVARSARIGQGVHIGPQCWVGEEATIGDGSVLVGQVYVGEEAVVGPLTTLHPGVKVLERCEIGAGCVLWPNVVVGADGFGYVPTGDGRGVMKVPHVGKVVIGDGVEIGAGTCIDRAKFGSTVVGEGTKIDNLVQVGHNVRIGRGCLICGQVGLAGSAVLEDGVILAGQAGVADAYRVGARARVGAQSGVMKDVPAGAAYMGYPAQEGWAFFRQAAILRKLSGSAARERSGKGVKGTR